MIMARPRLLPVIFVATLGFCAAANGPAAAQSTDVQSLYHEIERLRQDIRDLQTYVFTGTGGEPPPEGSAGAALPSGPSPARIAADLEYRMGIVDDQFRSFTGQLEEISHQIHLLDQRIEKLVADADFRLGELEQTVTDLQERAATAPPIDEAAGASAATLYPTVDELASGGAADAATPMEPVSLLPSGTDKEQYEHALAQVRSMQQSAGSPELAQAVERAALTLEEFIAVNADSDYAENASYWLGEVHYFDQDYERAFVIFARNYEKYPNGRKAPENLLKLAMSLGHIGRANDACQALRELRAKISESSDGLRQKADQQWARNGCQ